MSRRRTQRYVVGVQAMINFEREAEEITKRYHAEIEALAVKAREAMLSYFRKHGLKYKAGNGTWYVYRDNSEDQIDLPSWIDDLLRIEFDHNNLLGFWIGDI